MAAFDKSSIDDWRKLAEKELKGRSPEELVRWMLEDRVEARLNLQMHKVIWSPDATGV